MSEGAPLLDLADDMRRLRRECPWTRQQTHRSLARYLQEEAAEALEAIDAGDDAHLGEELGDLLLQVYFHAVVAEESGSFTLDDVARGIAEKMRRRNPHVFGPDAEVGGASELTAAEVDARWQQIKQAERPRRSAYDGIAPGLPALLLALKVLEREPDAPLPTESRDLGDRLLLLVAEARAAGVDPEQALRDAVRRQVPDGR
ncbi:MAG TPA: MazG nucleotide pyrophosphohydrolase domain-containing protein [Nocardioides sp.]|uniref:MazG nucleotide pyrophosphohydrolase domain-containing protein n=1 Tax=Nocardioides sp. TaxID=35761 RepID=UPI002E316A85|nr:MazG nucleotide pyrophosphohydrolase domain-containing protein [Nocardioides sp.]HEX3931477.1 MazG nucleotide pyrophosphohydrolase domain-containing protein [Nocardioides sp.]